MVKYTVKYWHTPEFRIRRRYLQTHTTWYCNRYTLCPNVLTSIPVVYRIVVGLIHPRVNPWYSVCDRIDDGGWPSDYGRVYAGDGDDIIKFGGKGQDYIEGGRGKDEYHVATGGGSHTSYDKEGDDKYYINLLSPPGDSAGGYDVTDLKGDDIYESKSTGSINSGGYLSITDHQGNDNYTLAHRGQTSITDYSGNDEYIMEGDGRYTITDDAGLDHYKISYEKGGSALITDKGKDGFIDTYTIEGASLGSSTSINDADGKGSLTIDGQSFNNMNFYRNSDNSFASSDGIWRLEQVLNADRTIKHYLLQKKYSIGDETKGHETVVALYGWQDEKPHLGMTLNEAPKPSTGDISTGNNLMGHTPWLGHEFLPDNYFGEGNSRIAQHTGGNLSLHHMLGYSGLPNGPIAVIFDDYPSQILGSSYGDQIQLGNGNNIVTAGLGNDFIITGDGNDWISSGISYVSELSDKDYVIAGKGADYIYGGKDDDTIISDGTEALNQTSTNERGDFVTANDGNDTIYGSNAKDILLGGAGEDTIYGGGGDDLILGDGDYQLRRATLISTDVPFLDFKWNEAGYFEYTLSKGVSLTKIPTTFSWDWTLDGSGGADITYKNSASKTDWLTEGGANDIIHGGAGDDWIAGQTGSDVIYGGEGDDIIYGDDIKPMDEALEGNDIIYGGHGSDTIYGGGGNDSLFAGEINQSHEELNADTVQDTLYGGKGDDILVATGGGDLLYGEEGNDTLIAAHGAKLYGGEGNDILVASKANNAELNGDEGDDTFYAGEGNNVTLNGGSGNDTFHLSTGKNTYINAGSGTNRYFITKETYSQGGETVIANDSGLWELYLDGRRITIQDLVKETEEGALLTRDNQYVLSNLGGDLYIGSLNMSYTGWVVIKNGANHASFTGLWDSSEDINNKTPETVGVIDNQLANKGDQFSLNITDYFEDDNPLKYSAFLEDGSELPNWLTIDEDTGLISGTPIDDQVSMINIIIIARDPHNKVIWQAFTLDVNKGSGGINQAPIINHSQDNLILDEKAVWSYQLSNALFSDPDGDQLTYKVVMNDGSKLPSWLIFDQNTLTLSGTAGNSDVGSLNLKVIATDPEGLSAEQGFNVTINNVNDAPIVTGIVNPMSTKEGDAFSWTLPSNLFTDIDSIHGDQLSYSITLADGSKLPSWLSFDPATGLLSGTPTAGAHGDLSLKITATDLAGASAAIDFGMTIEALVIPNRAPMINNPQDNLILDEKAVWSYQLSNALFSDPDGDQLTYKVVMNDGSTLPSWLIFDPLNLTLSGTAGNNDVGHLNLKVIATDPEGLSAEQGFNVTINNVNDAPQAVGQLNDQTTNAGEPWHYTLPTGCFIDIDKGDVLTYSLLMADGSNVPSWITIDSVTGAIKGVPSLEGDFSLVVVATDLAGAHAEHTLTLKVDYSSSNMIIGTEGKDWLSGTDGDDTFIGGKGDDEFYDNKGHNRYVFNKGDGRDSLYNYVVEGDADSSVTILFKDVASTEVQYYRSNEHLVIDYSGGFEDLVIVENYFLNSRFDIKTIQFTDKAVSSEALSIATSGLINSIIGSEDNDWMYGNYEKDNIIYGLGGDDNLCGNMVNDTLIGGNGNDTYELYKGNPGTGKDTIINYAEDGDVTTDRINFGNTHSSEAVYIRNGLDLIVRFSNEGEEVTIKDHFKGSKYEINLFEFTDKTLTCDEMIELISYSNSAPIVTGSIEDMSLKEGDIFSWTMPQNLFTDSDKNDVLSYSITLSDGSPLPSWLTFDPIIGILSGRPAGTHGELSFKITATDSIGESSSTSFNMTIDPLDFINNAPTAEGTLSRQMIYTEQLFTLALPKDCFIDSDQRDFPTYSLKMADGSALPDWMMIDPLTGTISGKAGILFASLDVVVVATDKGGLMAEHRLTVDINHDPSVNVKMGTQKNETLIGSPKNDVLYGLGGNDTLNGGTGDDTLIGGKGDDILNGGYGNDTYVISRTDEGYDEIRNYAADGDQTIDRMVFNDLRAGDLYIKRTGNDLVISSILDEIIVITIKEHFRGAKYAVNRFEFSDRTLTSQDIVTLSSLYSLGFNGDKPLPANQAQSVQSSLSTAFSLDSAIQTFDSGGGGSLNDPSVSSSAQKVAYSSMDQNPLTALYEADTYGANTGSKGMKADDARSLQSMVSAMAVFGTGTGSSNDLIDNNYSMVPRVFAPTN